MGYDFSESEIEEFRAEALELLAQAEASLLDVEGGGAFRAAFDTVFRAFHSLKGAAAMFDRADLQKHMHGLENDLSRFREAEGLDAADIERFLTGIDLARKLLAGRFGPGAAEAPAKPAAGAAPEPAKAAPPAPALPPAPARVAAKRAPDSKARVFLLDDEPDIVEILSDILRHAGFEVEPFCSPSAMLEAFRVRKPDLLLSDIKMPGMTGLEVLQRVRDVDLDLAVIFLSGHVTKDALMECLRLGANAVLEKPFEENEVIALCRLAERRARAARLLSRSVHLLLYQFADVDEALRRQNRPDLADMFREELEQLVVARRTLRDPRSV